MLSERSRINLIPEKLSEKTRWGLIWKEANESKKNQYSRPGLFSHKKQCKPSFSTAPSVITLYWKYEGDFRANGWQINPTSGEGEVTINDAQQLSRFSSEHSSLRLAYYCPGNVAGWPTHSSSKCRIRRKLGFKFRRQHSSQLSVCNDRLCLSLRFVFVKWRKQDVTNWPLTGLFLGISSANFHQDPLICSCQVSNSSVWTRKIFQRNLQKLLRVCTILFEVFFSLWSTFNVFLVFHGRCGITDSWNARNVKDTEKWDWNHII
jgi:hypothetical protein